MAISDALSAKISEALELIDSFAEPKRSACLWSSGKDSMLLLHLLRKAGIDPLVVFFREPWQPSKYEFADRVIREWSLQVVTPHPEFTAYQQEGGEIELQNAYRINDVLFTCPTGIVPPADDSAVPWVCGLKLEQRPLQGPMVIRPGPATFFMGSKECDSDPLLGGDGGVRATAVPGSGGVMIFNPLRKFSHQEVFQASLELNVPIDRNRYEYVAEERQWREKPDRLNNVDYVHACTKCIDSRPGAPAVVDCPLFEVPVANAAERVHWTKPAAPSYMRKAG